MAMREVKIPDGPADGGAERTFKKFLAIGDKMAGFFVKTQMGTGQYQKPQLVLRTKEGVDQVADMPYNLEQGIKQALSEGLKQGHPVMVDFTGTKDIGQQNPMKLFRVRFDPDITKLPAPKPYKPAEQSYGDEDIPF
jgi:hypothetical protein